MKSGFENQIYRDNLKVLQARLPVVFSALAADNRRPVFDARPYDNGHGQINVICTLPDGSRVALHDDEDI